MASGKHYRWCVNVKRCKMGIYSRKETPRITSSSLLCKSHLSDFLSEMSFKTANANVLSRRRGNYRIVYKVPTMYYAGYNVQPRRDFRRLVYLCGKVPPLNKRVTYYTSVRVYLRSGSSLYTYEYTY